MWNRDSPFSAEPKPLAGSASWMAGFAQPNAKRDGVVTSNGTTPFTLFVPHILPSEPPEALLLGAAFGHNQM